MPSSVCGNVRIELAVRPFQIGVRHERRAAMPGTGNVNHVQLAFLDDAIEMSIDEILSGRRAPMSQKARLDVFESQGFTQQRISQQIDLSHGEIVRGTPVGVNFAQLFGRERLRKSSLRRSCS